MGDLADGVDGAGQGLAQRVGDRAGQTVIGGAGDAAVGGGDGQGAADSRNNAMRGRKLPA